MLKLRNEFIFPPIKLGYSDGTGTVKERHLNFYRQRSKYIGAITLEPFYLEPGLREIPTQLGIDNDDKIDGLKKLAQVIRSNGAKTIAHLNHPGRMANPGIPGNFFWSSTASACENGGAVPEQMDREMMKKVIGLFVEGANRAIKAGIDLIEIQFGHGYLLAQFISPAVNKRDDEYGGKFDNRIRFPLEIAKAIREAVDVPLIARISGDEMIPKGFHIDEMVDFSLILEAHGIDALHVTAGTVCSTPPWFFQHMFIPKGKTWEMADIIRKKVRIPVIYVGRVNTKEDINNLLDKNKAEYLAIGRALIADPDVVGKFLGKVKDNITPCPACSEGCLGGVKSGQGLQCLVNPEAGQEINAVKRAEKPKKYAVVGGGLAGMQAALTLKKRGHTVDIFEKDMLGGQFNFAPLTPNKKSMAPLVPYFIEELKNKKVNVLFKEVTKSDILTAYDAAILATGSRPRTPDIKGLDKFYWADILLKENLPENKNILIIGGGLIGVDIATALIPKGNKVIIVKRTTDFGEDMEMIAKNLSLKMMKEKGTVFSDHTYIKSIHDRTVFATRKGKDIQFNDIDLIVVSTGMESYNPLEEELTNRMPTYVIGDARKIGNAQDAIRDAYDIARCI